MVEKKIIDLTKKHPISTTFILFLIGVFASLCFPSTLCFVCNKDLPILDEFLKALASGLLSIFLGTVIILAYQIKNLLEENYQPTYYLDPLHKKLQNIPKLTIQQSTTEFIDIAIHQINTNGFVQFDIDLDNYTGQLISFMKFARKSFCGSNIFRPKRLRDDLRKDTLKDTTTKKIFAQYFKQIRDSQCKSKIRLTVLTENEIKSIIQDSIFYLKVKEGTPDNKTLFYFYEFIPEIIWYLSELNGYTKIEPNVKVFWSTHKLAFEARNHNKLQFETEEKVDMEKVRLKDYVIFDEQILLLYRYQESKQIGRLSLFWNSPMNESADKENFKYWETCKLINDLLKGQKDIIAEPPILNLFSHFEDLVSAIPWKTNDDINIDLISDSIIKTELQNEVINHKKTGSYRNVVTIYKKIEDELKSGKWVFDETYLKEYDDVKIDKIVKNKLPYV